MKFIKNILLVIIAVQVMVVLQLLAIKYLNQKNNFNSLFNHLTLTSTPSLSQVQPQETRVHCCVTRELTPKEALFAKELKDKVENQIGDFFSLFIEKKSLVNQCHTAHPLTQKIESYAKHYLGTRYVWGATGPNKFDCSGFTQKVYRSAGVNLPRISREQAKVGSYIEYENLQRGDMVFFDTKRKKTGRVTHVGIYLEDGKFIHASSGNKRVVITNFNQKKFYKNRFLWGRRVFNQTVHQSVELFSLNKLIGKFAIPNFNFY